MNHFLIDTHLLLWSEVEARRLSAAARLVMEDPANELYFSAVSFWEIAIKRALGRPDFQPDPYLLRRALLNNRFRELPLTSDHAMAVERLPLIHKDIFDRMLIAQAISEGMTLLTADSEVAQYPGPIRRV